MVRTLFRLLLVLLLTACANDKTVVRNGHFQKRTLRPGWHVDLALGGERKAAQVHPPRSRTLAPSLLLARNKAPTPSTVRPMTAKVTTSGQQETGPYTSPNEVLSSSSVAAEAPITPAATLPERVFQEPGETMPKKPWNRLAIPAFVLAVLTVFLALFSLSTAAVILVAAATIVLAGISLKQIRRDEQAGKGFALAALIIGLIAALITGISILVIGFA